MFLVGLAQESVRPTGFKVEDDKKKKEINKNIWYHSRVKSVTRHARHSQEYIPFTGCIVAIMHDRGVSRLQTATRNERQRVFSVHNQWSGDTSLLWFMIQLSAVKLCLAFISTKSSSVIFYLLLQLQCHRCITLAQGLSVSWLLGDFYKKLQSLQWWFVTASVTFWQQYQRQEHIPRVPA